jgi:pimeloyl-ACP methyl ester carboxylesterase
VVTTTSQPSSKPSERSAGLFYRHASPDPFAPPMIHVHGFAISGEVLLPTAARLSDTFATYVPDLPGHGRSAGPRTPLGLHELADSLIHFLDDLGIERATFVGNSMGCPVISRLAIRYPDRIDRAIMVAPAGGPSQRPLSRALWSMALDGFREPLSLMPVAARAYARFGTLNAWRMFVLMTTIQSVRMLRDLDLPLLFVTGGRDPLLPSEARLQAMAEAFEARGNATAVRLPEAAHAINFSHPHELAAIIRAYMADPTLADRSALPATAEVVVAARR